MKKFLNSFARRISILVFLVIANSSYAQPPDPPSDPGGGGTTDIPIGGNAGVPIDGGFSILMTLSGIYGGIQYKRKNKEKRN